MRMAKTKRARKAVPVLTLMIPLAALVAITNVAISMGTSNWLDSYERIPIANTSVMEEFMIKRTISGLWYLCSFNLTERQFKEDVNSVPHEEMNCSSIDYFNRDRYTSDQNDSTNAIRYAVTKAGPLFVIASILLGLAMISAAFGFQRHRRLALFISGIAFVVSGLMLLIGLVVYLSALQSEIGPKLRPRTSVDLPQFSYKYGFSFILVVVGFMATETTGILAIFYYIYWHQLDWTQKLGSETFLGSNGSHGNNLSGSRSSGHGHGPSSSRGRKEFRCQSVHHNANANASGSSVRDPFPKGYRIMDLYDTGFGNGSGSGNGNGSCGRKRADQDGQQGQCQGHGRHGHHPSCNAYLLEKEKEKGGLCNNHLGVGPEFDIPFPPPPPPPTYSSIPRDYTTLTTCSDGEDILPPPPPAGSLGRREKEREHRNTHV